LIPNDEPLRPWLDMNLEPVNRWRIGNRKKKVVEAMEENVFQWRKVLKKWREGKRG